MIWVLLEYARRLMLVEGLQVSEAAAMVGMQTRSFITAYKS